MEKLNFPSYKFLFKSKTNKPYIFDVIRKKYILLTPEEWVRQHCIRFLIEEKKFPKLLLNVEKVIRVNNTVKRFDIIAYNKSSEVALLVECKSPKVKISQQSFDQLARYDSVINSQLLMITNGLSHYYFRKENEQYQFLQKLPPYTPSNL